MQTRFTKEQLTDPGIAATEPILRKCVHCGFCLPTCPTYVLEGNETNSPRGRIYLMKMGKAGEVPAVAVAVAHSSFAPTVPIVPGAAETAASFALPADTGGVMS